MPLLKWKLPLAGTRSKGRDFIRQVDELFKTIASEPERFAIVHRDARQAIMHRFPYSIIFAVRGDYAEILSVFHSSRNPRSWKRRVN